MLLQHPDSLAKTAHNGISSNAEENSGKMVEEYRRELDADVQMIKKAAASFNQDAAAAVNRYQTEYEMHLSVWLNTLSRCANTTNAGDVSSPDSLSIDIQRRSRKAENKFKRFREWRSKALKGVQRKFLPKWTPVTELESAKENLKQRENKQRLMKKANTVIRSKREVIARLIELLGPGSEEEAARLQQPGEREGEITGYTAHELNNNNANIFRLKRRVKELERKIGLMQHRNEEMKEMNGIKMIYNYAADRIQLFFTEKPLATTLRQLKGNGWHWSPSAGCWQRKITGSAKKSAESIYKGESSEERKTLFTSGNNKSEKDKAKSSKKIEHKKVSENIIAKVAEASIEKAEEVVAGKVEKKGWFKGGAKKEKIRVPPTKVFKREFKAELKIELKPKPAEKPKVIDWAKIASQVEKNKATEVVEEVKHIKESDDGITIRDYSYEAYTD